MGHFAVLDFDDDGPTLIPASQLPETPSAIPSLAQAVRKALSQKGEYVEYRGLAAAVRPEQHGQRRHLLQLDVPQRPVVFDMQSLDARWMTGWSHWDGSRNLAAWAGGNSPELYS